MKIGSSGNFLLPTLILLVTLILGGCTIVTYELRDELTETKNPASCDIAFTLDLQSGYQTNSSGAERHKVEARRKLRERYIESTLSTLNDLGCSARHAASPAESNFQIAVSRQLQLSALPQEWLTGISFGLIPSWGTRHGQFRYDFTHSENNRHYNYQIDQNNYNHLVLLPVFWVSFFTADEQNAYSSALTNFIKSA